MLWDYRVTPMSIKILNLATLFLFATCILAIDLRAAQESKPIRVGGAVWNVERRGVAGVGIIITDPSGQLVARVVTGDDGQFKFFESLANDLYFITVEPPAPYQGGTSVMWLGKEGLTVHWLVFDPMREGR